MFVHNTKSASFIVLLAALILPAGVYGQSKAVLSVSPTSFGLQGSVGQDVSPQTVQIRNAGNGALKWSIVGPGATWLSVSPLSGTNSGTVTLTFRTSALAAGTYQTAFRVDSNSGSSVTVSVSLTLSQPQTALPPSDPEPAPPPPPGDSFVGTTIYVSTSGSDTNSGTQSSPVRTIQRGVQLAHQANAAGQASRVLIAAGVYRESVLLDAGQKTDAPMIIEGAGASTVLTGADVWTAWVAQSDGSLTHHWPYKWGMKPIPSGWEGYWNWDGNGYKRDILRRSEMVYVNGQPLRGVLKLSELVAGTFYVDENTARLHVRLPSGLSLAQATIEVGTRLIPLRINVRRHLTLRRFAVMRNRGAVGDVGFHVTNSRHITLENMTVRWLANAAFGGAYNTTVRIRDSVFSDNGVMALSQYRDVDVLIENSEIARNNWRGWSAEHKGWGTVHKWGGIRDGMVRRTRFVNNMGHGFWVDSDNKRVTLENSLISGNGLHGVWIENNQGPLAITGNRICNNAVAGLADGRSDRVTLRNNQIWGTARFNVFFTGHYGGRTMTDWQTGESITNKSRYWTVDGNIIAGSGTEGWLWWHTDYNAPGAWAEIRNTMILTDNNRWYHSGRTNAFRLPQGTLTHSGFRSDLQLAKSGHEASSVWQAPPTLSCTMP